MRAVFALVLVIGLGLAGFAVYMVQGYFEQQEAALQAERQRAAQAVPTVVVYAAKTSLEYGDRLTPDSVQPVRYAEAHLPEGVFLTEEELFPAGPEVLRTVVRPMEPNEPVMAIKVTAPGEAAGMTTRITRGMRAFAIRVDVASGVSGFLRPGDRVDVYWTGRGTAEADLGGGTDITKLIETGLKLVAVDQSANGEWDEANVARTVTVEVTPQQVAVLAQAQSTGSLSLALVGNDDDTVAAVIEVNQRALLGLQAPEQVVEAEIVRDPVCTIRTRRGAEVMDIVIPCTN